MEERRVTVRDKNGNLIAVFSNLSTVHESEAQKNLMHSPTIEMVTNGESTLSFQMLIASDKWQQIKNPENLFYCNNRVYTALNEQSVVYNGYTADVTLVELWYLLKYKFVQAYNVDTSLEPLDTHTVKILPKTDSKLKLTVNGVAYDDSQVRDSRGVLMPRGSAGYALWALLKGTDWSLGVCDVLPDGFNAKEDYGTFNVESDMKNVLENIQLVQSLYGGILDWDSVNKRLSLRDERKEGTDFNTWKGFVARHEKNLIEYPKVQFDSNLITRLYPLGNGNLNIANVNGGKNYIDNFSYTNKVYEGYLQNTNIYDTNDEGGQKTLKFWGQRKVSELCKPRKSVTYNIVDKRGTEDGWAEPFDINDVIKAYYIDTETGNEVWEYLRITHLVYNWFWPGSDTQIEVGDKVSNEMEIFHQVYKFTEASIPPNSNGTINGSDIVIPLPEDYLYELYPEYVDIYGDDWYDYLYGNGGGWGYLSEVTNLHAEHETANSLAIADLSVYADETFATIESFTSFEHWTEDEFQSSWTQINQTSSALEAQITLEAYHYKETKDAVSEANSKIQLTANDLEARIDQTTRYAKEYADGRYNEANTRITQVSNELGASINIVAANANRIDNELVKTNANLTLTANSLKAEIDAKATYSYVNEQTGAVSNSLAQFKAEASQSYASASIVATVNNNTARINAIANGEVTYVSLQANYIVSSGNLSVTGAAGIGGGLTVYGGFGYAGVALSLRSKTINGQNFTYLGSS